MKAAMFVALVCLGSRLIRLNNFCPALLSGFHKGDEMVKRNAFSFQNVTYRCHGTNFQYVTLLATQPICMLCVQKHENTLE